MTMLKRKDGSYSKRGLWDNIRANKGSGKKPTKEMLEQEKKIKNKNKMGGLKKMYGGTKKKMMQKGGAKPDYLDMDKDGNKTESMKSAISSKKKMQMGGQLNPERAKPGKITRTKIRVQKAGESDADYKKYKESLNKKMKSPFENAKNFGLKKVKKMMGGKKKKNMYQSGGFLEPGIERID
tara:strand:- start:409 stop:951 length:543 start_codon:yes stop_codon:yes gene_type:complete